VTGANGTNGTSGIPFASVYHAVSFSYFYYSVNNTASHDIDFRTIDADYRRALAEHACRDG